MGSISRGTTDSESPGDRFERSWRENGPQDPAAFLVGLGNPSMQDVAAVLCADQRLRWKTGERVTAQDYLDRFPAARADAGTTMDLVFNEYLLREEYGPPPDEGEFARRYPAQTEELREHLMIGGLLADAGDTTESLAAWQAGQRVGRYRLVKRIGQGGMGVVFLAEDGELRRPVALKVAGGDVARNPKGEARFLREARAAAAVRHPHLCPIFDFGRAAGGCYFTMPFFPGGTLRDRLAKGLPDPATAVAWVVKAARGVAVLHRSGFVHRDLKPGNIMFDEHDEPVVMDFGLVRPGENTGDHLTSAGTVVGTPAYMPPEAVGGELCGPAGDVYSLGATLYEALTGRLPFEGSRSEMAMARLTRDPESPSRVRPGLGTRFDAVCARAMARQPADRYPSMEAFVADLEAAAARAPRQGRRWRGTWIGGVAGVLAALAGLILYLGLLGPSAGPSGDIPPSPPRSFQGEVAADGFSAGAVWSGEFRFREFPGQADLLLEVLDRTGDAFRGRYVTEKGAHEWLVEGSVAGDRVEWQFTRAVLGDPGGKATLVGQAHVVGTVKDGTFTGLFEYLNGGTPADMTLKPDQNPKAGQTGEGRRTRSSRQPEG